MGCRGKWTHSVLSHSHDRRIVRPFAKAQHLVRNAERARSCRRCLPARSQARTRRQRFACRVVLHSAPRAARSNGCKPCNLLRKRPPDRQRRAAGTRYRTRGTTHHHHGTTRSDGVLRGCVEGSGRSEEHTSELQSLMHISYAVFCLKKKKQNRTTPMIH